MLAGLMFAVLASAALAPAGVSAADTPPSVWFCTTDDSSCQHVQVGNGALVVVTRVRVKQLSGPTGCAEKTKTHKQNMLAGDKFIIAAQKNCAYQIRFNTTSGCTGDKKRTIGPQDYEKKRTRVTLTGACGSLDVNKTTAARASSE